MKLGKQKYEHDERTLMLGEHFSPTLVLPPHYDFDHRRASFPLHPWGNDAWGNCVVVGRAQHLMRLERLEQRRTLKIQTEHVVEEYKQEQLRQFGVKSEAAGDRFDRGLVVLAALRDWRGEGWQLKLGSTNRNYKVAAFGEVSPGEYEQIKGAIYLLHGVQLGFWLPRGVQGKPKWEYNGERGPDWEPGSWGGHLVYAKAYDGDEVEIITWGLHVTVTRRFIERYCDEAWAVVDNFNYWRKRPEIDMEGVIKHLRNIGARNIE